MGAGIRLVQNHTAQKLLMLFESCFGLFGGIIVVSAFHLRWFSDRQYMFQLSRIGLTGLPQCRGFRVCKVSLFHAQRMRE